VGEVEVTQADRIAAAPMAVLAEMRDLILAGKADHYAEPFARHREQARREALEEVAAMIQSEWSFDKRTLVPMIRKLKGD